MNGTDVQELWVYGIFITVIFFIGIYCLLVTYNLMRALIGIEILFKGVTLLIIVAGYKTGNLALAQSIIITMIVIEVGVVVVAMGLILGIHGHYKTLATREMKDFKE